ncbi:unnamed protein product [Cyclocybe aegerita]|uniref:Uncharacterized protein n=1 Tax=Cyclocybe aegerita TaxID=1973307 RepID=A0A8S0VQU8_CYCAE|nr:unnamed protein product [Cyclocybe aegerita]
MARLATSFAAKKPPQQSIEEIRCDRVALLLLNAMKGEEAARSLDREGNGTERLLSFRGSFRHGQGPPTQNHRPPLRTLHLPVNSVSHAQQQMLCQRRASSAQPMGSNAFVGRRSWAMPAYSSGSNGSAFNITRFNNMVMNAMGMNPFFGYGDPAASSTMPRWTTPATHSLFFDFRFLPFVCQLRRPLLPIALRPLRLPSKPGPDNNRAAPASDRTARPPRTRRVVGVVHVYVFHCHRSRAPSEGEILPEMSRMGVGVSVHGYESHIARQTRQEEPGHSLADEEFFYERAGFYEISLPFQWLFYYDSPKPSSS